MAILITGATGLLGSHLSFALMDKEVVALVRDQNQASLFFSSGMSDRVTLAFGNLQDDSLIERLIVQYEIERVFHLGAQTLVGCGVKLPVETLESNVRGTYLLLEACRKHKDLVKHIVIASSDKAYGNSLKLPYTEEMPLQGVSPYDVSKSCCDLIAQSYLRTYEMPIAIARCGNLFGPGDLNFSRLIPGTIKHLLEGKQPVIRSDGTLKRDYLYVQDAVSGYLKLAQQRACGAFNFGHNCPMSVVEVVQAICEGMGERYNPVVLGENGGEIQDQYLDSTKAKKELGWSPDATFSDALSATIDWYSGVYCEA